MNHMYRAIAKTLATDSRIHAAYVIGSSVRGDVSPESDFDLAVVVQNAHSITQDQVYELIRHISFPRDLDLSVVDTTSSPLFLFHIVRDGEVIYEVSRQARMQFEAYALHTYYDSAHMRAIYAQYLQERFTRSVYAH